MPGRVAVTGATGFIGASLLKALVKNHYQVRALTRQPQAAVQGVQWITGNLSDTRALINLTSDVDSVIHCAGQVRGSSLEQFLKTNSECTLNLVKVSSSQNTPPRFLLVSSLAAREPQLSWYADSKYRGERLLANNAGNMKWSIFRPTAVYGPGDKELAPLLKLSRLGLLPMAGAPGSRFGLLYVDDLVTAIISWLKSDEVNNGIYELDDGTDGGYDRYLVRDIARHVWGHPVYIISIPLIMLRLMAGINLCLSRVLHYLPMLTPGKVRELAHHDWVCDNGPIKKDYGWTPGTTLAEGLLKIG